MFDPIAYINEPRWQQSRLGLDRIRELLDRLGRPQDRLRFVHVAGTNGKGSTCAYLASILQAAGYRTGLFTSPYLETFEERIRVDGENIPAADLLEATLEVREQAEALTDHPTEFERMCAVALVHFARSACDVVVLEVGLGGRFDATNVIDAPEACVIARIGVDHTKLLGNTLTAIAKEKAGIVKHGAPVVSYPQDPEAMAVIELAAAEAGDELAVADFAQLSCGKVAWSASSPATGAGSDAPAAGAPATGGDAFPPATVPGKGVQAADSGAGAPCRQFSYREFRDLQTALLGSYQPSNAALAIETVRVLRERGWNIPDEAVREGVADARWPGRFEIVGRDPLFVVDGGHNPQGARALVDTLHELMDDSAASRQAARPRVVFVIGVLEDKDYPSMLEAVLPEGDAFVALTPDNPRALPADKLARAIRWTGQDLLGCSACVKPYVSRDAQDAVRQARELAGDEGIVVAFGSLYSVAALKAAL